MNKLTQILIDGPDQIFYQWDRGQRLLLHGVEAGTRVDISGLGRNNAISVCCYAEGERIYCDVPDALLMEPHHIQGYVYETDEDRGETVFSFLIPVIPRPRPEDYVEPEEIPLWSKLETRVAALEKGGSSALTEKTMSAEYTITGFIQWVDAERSSVSTSANGRRTDYIPTEGVVKIYGNAGLYTGCFTVAFYDANKTYMPAISVTGKTFITTNDQLSEGTYELDISGDEYAEAKYFIASTYRKTSGVAYTQTFADDFCKYVKLVEGESEEAPRYRIADSKIAFFGDSITKGAGDGDYPSMVAGVTGARVTNYGVGGATLATGTTASNYIYDLVTGYDGDDDIICISGGYNDYGLGVVPLGELTDSYTAEVDTTTVIGALEGMFRHLLTNHTTAKLYYIITHKANGSEHFQNAMGLTLTDYHDAIVKVLNKYSIPYYDAFLHSGFVTSPLAAWGETIRGLYTSGANGNPDGIHPNAEGYRKYYLYQIIAMLENGGG